MTVEMEFADSNKPEKSHKFKPPGKGCYVSRKIGFFMFLTVVALLVIVAVTVYFGHPDYNRKDDDKGGKSESVEGEETTPNIAPTMAPTTPGIEVDIRLSGDLMPTHYDVRLRPDIYQDNPEDFMFTGTVRAHLNVVTTTSTIYLHIKMLEVDYDSIKVFQVDSNERLGVDRDAIRHIEDVEFLEIPMMSPLSAGSSIVLHANYSGPLRKDLYGIYYSDYLDENNEPVYLLTSQLQATDARKVFPCLDEPALKATFNVTLERRASHSTKSNTRIIETVDMGDGWFADIYESTPKMSTYLLAFLISDFQCRERSTQTGILVEVCARPTAYDQLEFAGSIAVEMQEWFEWYHNLSYPLPKMTHAAVPDFSAGAMENWGLVLYRETALLYDPMTSSAANKQRVAVVVSHELAHMWFGDLVTPTWWDDIWLNEGFASYMELQGVHNVHDFDKWRMEEQFLVEDLQYVMVQDSLVTSHPIYQPVYHPDQINELFDSITYSKGSSVIRMMRYFLGDEIFRFGLSNYLKDNIYSATNHTELFNSLTQEAHSHGKDMDVSAIMNTWIQQMGYPVVTVHYDDTDGDMRLDQKHFLLDPTQNVTTPSMYNYIWKVPFTFMDNMTPMSEINNLDIHWLTTAEGAIDSDVPGRSWVLANVGQQFYYRVNYEMENWEALIDQLNEDHERIPIPNRAQIIDDLFNLGRSGEVPQVLALRATSYMKNEKEYTNWYALRRNMRYVSRMFGKGDGSELLGTYMQSLVSDIAQELGYEESADDEHLQQRMRSLIAGMACGYGISSCTDFAIEAFRKWVNSSFTDISVNLAALVHCYGVREGGEAEWLQAHARLVTSNSGAERRNLLNALGCSRQSWILERYLHWALAEDEYGIAQQDMQSALLSVARNPAGVQLAWSFFKANWETFCERFCTATFALTNMVKGLTETFSTDWELKDLQNFIAMHPEQGSAKRAFQQAVESTMTNIKWREQNEHEIIDWLKSYITPMVTPGPEIEVDIRLPGNLVPTHYDVTLRPDIYKDDPMEFMFNGIVKAYLDVEESTNMIYFHIKMLDVDYDSIQVYEEGSNSPLRVNRDAIRYIEAAEFLEIPMTSPLMTGRSIVVHASFTGPLRKDLHGIYYSDYLNENNERVYLLTSQLQATDARKIFPCLDEPALKATFNVTLERKTSHNTRSNTQIIQTEVKEDGWVADIYEETPKMSTYLLAFLISDFICRERYSSTNVLVQICARPNAHEQTEFASSIAVEIQEWYEWYFNISYPLSKMTHAAVPDFAAGAMENWGLVLYRETALLYDPMTSSAANRQRVAQVVSHELAHMWFGDLVTPTWWDDIWLNEGFASYMENQGIHNVHDYEKWRMEDQFVVQNMQYVMAEDSLVTSHPVYQPVSHPDEISAIFDRITYYKGNSVIRMMRYFLGNDTFRFGLSNYLKDHLYSHTTHNALFQRLTQQAQDDGKDIDVSQIMNTWILQMGYPVVMVDYDSANGEIDLSQKYFLLDPSQNVTTASPYNYLWEVPVTLMNDMTTMNSIENLDIHWFSSQQETIDNDPDRSWVLANIGQHFYYRVNYNMENWDALIEQLNANHERIPVMNRAQVIDDLFNLGRAGEVPQVLAMRATSYMNKETVYTNWYALSRNMRYIRLMLNKGVGKDLLETYMQSRVLGISQDLGYTDDQNDEHLTSRLRSLVSGIACVYGLPSCLSNATAAFNTWIDSNFTNISVNFANIIHCYGVREGGEKEWQQAYNRFLVSNSAAERDNLLAALGCSQHPWILERYLHWGLAEDEYGIAQQDLSDVFYAVSRNPVGTHLAWSFFKANWGTICERICSATFTLSNIVRVLTETFSTEWELRDLQNFISLNPEQGIAQRAFQQAVESTINNVRWKEQNEQAIIDWLMEYNNMR